MTRKHLATFTQRLTLIILVITALIACGGGGGGDGSGNTTSGQGSIFPTNQDSISIPTESTTITIDDVDIEVASREVIAIFNETATSNDYSDLMEYLDGKGYEKIGQIPEMGFVQIKLSSDGLIQTTIDEISNLEYIETAYPNIIIPNLSDSAFEHSC
jgi:hypothetical protein